MFDDLFAPPKGGKGIFDLDLFPSQEEKKGRKYIYKDYRNKLWKKQKGKCARCKKKLDPHNYHIDHKKPVALGGKTTLSNLQLLCPRCHMEKTAEDRRKIAERKKHRSREEDIFDIDIFGSSGRSRKPKDPFDLW